MLNDMNEEMIAPCGLNCGVCKFYLARERGQYKTKSSGCTGCISANIECGFRKGCEKIRNNNYRFCYECADFPCKVHNMLEKRYVTKFYTSPIDNLRKIREKGMDRFLAGEEEKWKCPECGGTVSMHTGTCYECGSDSWKK